MMIRKAPWLTIAPLMLALFVSPTTAAAKSTRISDTDYLAVSDWARANNLRWGWIKRDSTLYVTNRNTKLLLIANSREAQVNNIQVWLQFPLVNRAGGLFISQLDVDATLGPLISPPHNRKDDSVKTICIDPGHGGKDTGNRVGSRFEKDYTLRLAKELRDQLQKAGFTVRLTRSDNSTVDLSSRPASARAQNADLFVSLHFNAASSGRSSVKGAETYALTPEGGRSTAAAGKGPLASQQPGNRNDQKNMLLAYEIQNKLVRQLSVEDRGVKRARFQVLREATMPAVLIEGGFMSHPTEGKKIFDAVYRRRMAGAITDGILAYKRAVE
jgi:N-acetylmuramoyl-L-alanine amidase